MKNKKFSDDVRKAEAAVAVTCLSFLCVALAALIVYLSS